MEEKKIEPSKEPQVELMVIDKLPEKPFRDFTSEDGTNYHLITRDEALTEILETRKIKKSVA